MDWEVRGTKVEAGRFAPFAPIDVLVHNDGPRIFTFDDSEGGLCLACWSDEDESASRFIVAPVTPQVVADLQGGLLSTRESLDQARVYLVDVAHSGEPTAAWRVALADIPADASPQPRVMLHRELEPFFSLRAIGETIERGHIPGSVIRTTVEAAQKSIKILAEYESELESPQGRPSRALRGSYDLPLQLMRAASFEVAFRSPLTVPGLFDDLTPGERDEEGELFERIGAHSRLNALSSSTASPTTSPERTYSSGALCCGTPGRAGGTVRLSREWAARVAERGRLRTAVHGRRGDVRHHVRSSGWRDAAVPRRLPPQPGRRERVGHFGLAERRPTTRRPMSTRRGAASNTPSVINAVIRRNLARSYCAVRVRVASLYPIETASSRIEPPHVTRLRYHSVHSPTP